MIVNLANALHSLAPGSTWSYEDEDYDTINWLSEDIAKPTKEAVEAELLRLNEIKSQEETARLEAEAAKAAAKESAMAKLSAFGLTEDEIKAIVGV